MRTSEIDSRAVGVSDFRRQNLQILTSKVDVRVNRHIWNIHDLTLKALSMTIVVFNPFY